MVIATAQLMVMLDLTIVNIALPAMQRELGFSTTNLSWVVNAYVLAFGGLLLLGGRLGDLLGRRRMLVIGIALFTTASLVGGLASTQLWLIVARSVQGIGAAIASPTALSLVATTFPEGRARHRAMAVYAGMSGAGGALGLLLGGILVETVSWRWVLFVNVPIGVALMISAVLVLPAVTGTRGRLDIAGAISVSGAMALLVFGLERAPSVGWADPYTVGAFVAAGVLMVGFIVIESGRAHALVPMRFLRHRNRAAGFGVMLLLGASMLSLLYFLTQFLQNDLHYSPIIAGVAYLPIPVAVGSVGLVVSRLVGRWGVRPFLTAGPLMVAAGLLWASMLNDASGYPAVFGPLVFVGIGMGLSFVPLTLNAVSSVRDQEAGLASGLLNTSQQVGGSLGLAALVTVAATVSRDHLSSVGAAAHGFGRAAAGVAGFQAAMRGGAIAATAAFLIAVAILRSRGTGNVDAPRSEGSRTETSGATAASGTFRRIGASAPGELEDGGPARTPGTGTEARTW
ncbi:MAG: MFS transporter [Acidimicrobiales bacterium]